MCYFVARFAPSLANVNLMQMLGPNTAKEVDKQVNAGVVSVIEWCFWRLLATVCNRYGWRNRYRSTQLPR
jgi:hypothetical protein